MATISDMPVIVFGLNSLAALAAYSLAVDGGREVVAFTVDDRFAEQKMFEGLPVVGLSALSTRFPPDRHEALVPLGFSEMNAVRRRACDGLKSMGYALASHVSKHATLWPGFSFPEHAIIYEQCIVQPFVTLGSNVTLRAGVNLGHHAVVGDDVFVASGVTTGGNVVIGAQSFIGLGAVIRDGVTLGERSFIGAGAVVVKDTEADGVYTGNPARKMAKTSLDVTRG